MIHDYLWVWNYNYSNSCNITLRSLMGEKLLQEIDKFNSKLHTTNILYNKYSF